MTRDTTSTQTEEAQDGRRSYRPSNSTEADGFESRWCHQCAGWFGGWCSIARAAATHDFGTLKYPRQWVRDDTHPWGTCTSFTRRDVDRHRVGRSPLRGQLTLPFWREDT